QHSTEKGRAINQTFAAQKYPTRLKTNRQPLSPLRPNREPLFEDFVAKNGQTLYFYSEYNFIWNEPEKCSKCTSRAGSFHPIINWRRQVAVCDNGVSDMQRIPLMLIFCLTIGCVSTEQAFAQQIPLTARTLEAFRRIKPHMSMKQVIEICGVPDKDIGSGIHIYVYRLSDGSIVRIGTPDKKRLVYVVHVLPSGEARSVITISKRKEKRKRRVRSTRHPTTH